jgi:hypothetical protein
MNRQQATTGKPAGQDDLLWSSRPYLAQDAGIWDAVVNQARNGTFIHLRAFMDYHAHRFDEVSRIIYRKNTPVAVFAANRTGNQLVSHAGLTFGGLLYPPALHAHDVLEIFSHLAACYRQQGIRQILYKCVPTIFQRTAADDDLYALFRQQARLIRRDLSCAIDLHQRPRSSELRRRVLRKAQSQGLEIREGLFFAEFHQLLSQVLEKHGASPVHSAQELALLQQRFPQQIRLFGAYAGEQLLAASWIFDYGQTAHTQYLACAPEGMPIGALDYLLEHLISTIFADHRWFSFGISTEDGGHTLNQGLMQYKEGFGARALTNDSYQWDLT